VRLGILARGALAVLLLVSTVSANAQSVEAVRSAPRIDIAAHVREASQRFGIPEHWIFAVIRIESAGRIRAVSSAGAMGLMQLMPGTWARQRARFSLGSDPFDPRDNIMAGTSYLREMYDRYGVQGFLAAYNAGPGRYEDWLGGRRSLPLETRRYVGRIAPLLQRERRFVAAEAQAVGEPTRAPCTLADASQRMVPASEPVGPANPFALHPRSARDLFAPVSTASDP
jgi:soluble lytic murein transglycosylase-like protein